MSARISKTGKAGKRKTAKLQIKTLLYPQVQVGGKIRVEAENITGLFKVAQVVHTGDTHGSDWTTEIEAHPT